MALSALVTIKRDNTVWIFVMTCGGKRLRVYAVFMCMVVPALLTGCARLHGDRRKESARKAEIVTPSRVEPVPQRARWWHRKTAGKKAAVVMPAPVMAVASPKNMTQGVRLRPGFIFNLTVLVGGKKEFEERAKRVTDEGTVNLPLVGTVVVQDLTQGQLQALLTGQYGAYLVNPQVSIDLVQDEAVDSSSPWGSVTVLGRVKKPGRVAIPATRDLTVSMAVQQAGGFDTSAKDSAIRITRSAGGKTGSREVNLRAVGAQGKVGEDIVLKSGDVVFVPELRF
jgi:polysaccharide export outer membrane protein